MGLAGGQFATDLQNAGGVMVFHIGFFPLRTGKIRVHILQLLGGDERNIPIQFHTQLGETDVEPVVGVADGPDDGPDNEFQIVQIPVFLGDDLFPVPLVHVYGVDVVQAFVSADGVHIGVQTGANAETVPL